MQSRLCLAFVATLTLGLGACSGNSTGTGGLAGNAGATASGGEGGRDEPGSGGSDPVGGNGTDGGASSGSGGQAGGAAGGTGGRSGGPEVIVEPVDQLLVDEANGTAAFTVVLGSAPTADVVIELSNSAEEDLSLDTNALTFTSTNWDEAQTVTLTGIDDAVADGDQPFVIITAPAASDDDAYDGINAANVEGTVLDDDVASISVQGGQGLSTTEQGDTATITLVLTSEPASRVTLAIAVSDDTEGTVSTSEVTFTPGNWDTPQTVTVTGLDDDASDGDVTYEIVLGPSVSDDPNYDGLELDDISLVNRDDDAPAVIVTPTQITTSEGGGEAFFTVELTVAPSHDVTIDVASLNTDEATVSPASLTFTPNNWENPQIVTVTGVDDTAADGDVSYTIDLGTVVSNDPSYSGLEPADVSGTNLDDDAASVVVTPTTGLQTSELGGTATFTVVLGTAPSARVTIALSSSNPNEGVVDVESLVFNANNWSTPQTVTIAGVDDSDSDGPVGYTIVTGAATSTDPAYDGLEVVDVTVTNLDDELSTPAILVTPTGGLQTTEAGDTATFTVVLGTPPASTVGITLSVGDTSEGSVDRTTLIFSASSWSEPQTITVSGLDDGIDDGDVTYTISSAVVSNDEDYAALSVPDVSVTNRDDDEVGITVSAAGILETTEMGGAATFTVVLDCQPASTVTIPLSSSDESEGTVSPVNLSFSTSNWATPQTVTVTGVNDTADDGNVPYTVLIEPASSSDPAYSGLDAPDVIVNNVDNDPVIPCANPDMIDDLEDGDDYICENGGRTGSWYWYNESTTGSQVLDVILESREDSIVAIETTGTSIGSWGATFGVSLYGVDLATRLPYDVSGYTGIRFWARRGPASSYPTSVTVNIVQRNTANTDQGGTCNESVYECSDHYADTISVSSAWRLYELPFTGFYQASGWGTTFPRDLENVLGFEFLIERTSFDLIVDDLAFY